MSHSSFINYYQDYKHKVFSFLHYRLSGRRELAEDLTSETFAKAYEKFETYDDSYSFSTWVYTIARNTLIDYLRTKKETLDLEVAENTGDEKNNEDKMSTHLDTKLTMKRIHSALKELPEFQKDCIILKYLDEMTTKEIAKILESSEENVRQGISRGMKKIKVNPSLLISFFLLLLSNFFKL